MLELKNLAKFYEFKKHWYLKKERKLVFENINLSLNLGENLLISGASGAGKSTLAKVICGIENPSFGEVLIKNLHKTNKKRELAQKISYVFQDQKLALNPYKKLKTQLFSVLNNFKLKKDLNLINDFLNDFNLKPCILEQKPLTLSGGEAARIGLIRHLILRPNLLILDELTSSLDLLNAKKILDFLKNYQAKNEISYIFITHQEELFKDFECQILKL